MRKTTLIISLVALFLLCLAARLALMQANRPEQALAEPLRIVSLAPSLTETLFAVGLGSRVVGVTEFCVYPPEVAALPKVAGFSQLNLEALMRVRPDLVVMPFDKIWNRTQIERLGIPVLALEVRSLAGLKEGIKTLGALAASPAKADALLAGIELAIAEAARRSAGKARPGVLFSVMHAYQGLGQINEISAIGRDGFYDELITLAGGCNVYEGSLAYPRLSREAIIFLNPDVIIDVIPAHLDAATLAAVRREWFALTNVNAVKAGRVFVLNDEMHTVPGPRFIETLQVLSEAFHPGGEPEIGGEALHD